MHYYTKTGEACHWVPKKDGSGNRPTTVADCRKLDLLPSPTTVLRTLSKPALIEWLIRQAVYAFATAPDVGGGETLDAKITRVLDVERQQDQESEIAKDRGTDIHDAIESALKGEPYDQSLKDFVCPVVDAVMKLGRVVSTEKILVGVGCAGRTDAITEDDTFLTVCDFKTCKDLPKKEPWPEAKMQAAFYAHALGNTGEKRVRTAIICISKNAPGQIAVFVNEDWQAEYRKFRLLQDFWYLSNNIEMNY